MLLGRSPSVAVAISFLCRPIKFSSLFNPLKLQKRECKTSEVLLISLQPKIWRRKKAQGQTSMTFHIAHSTTIILLEYYCSDWTYTKLEQRGHLTQVAFIYYLFSEFLFQRVGKAPLSAGGFSHFSMFLQTFPIPWPRRQSPSVAQSKPVSLASPWKFPVFPYWAQI